MSYETWFDNRITHSDLKEFSFPVIMAIRVQRFYDEKLKGIHNNPHNEDPYLLNFGSWTPDEIEAHFYGIEFLSNLQLYINEEGKLDTKYQHKDAVFYVGLLRSEAIKTSSKEVYQRIKGEEYGIFELPEETNIEHKKGGGNGTASHRNVYTKENRPTINGKVVRKMYQGADYVCAGRALYIGLIEKKHHKTVIWLSVNEHKEVLKYVMNRKKRQPC